MQSFNYEDVLLAGREDISLRREFAYSTARFATFLSNQDGKLSTANLHHYTLWKGNRFAIQVLERTNKFRGKFQYLPDQDIQGLGNWTSCAVVGNSKKVLKHKRGKEIDGHTAVLRFNQAPTRGFEKFVGSKTTARLQNPERQGFAEGDEFCLTEHYSGLSNKKCKIVPLSPQFVAYTRYLWTDSWGGTKRGFVPSRGKHNEKRLKMSTGFIGIALALHLCSKVTLYGFESGAGANEHYYNKTTSRSKLTDWHIRHPWKLERDCLKIIGNIPSVKVV